MRIVFVTPDTAGSIVPEHIARILVGIPSGRIGGIRGPLVFQQAGELIQIITRRVTHSMFKLIGKISIVGGRVTTSTDLRRRSGITPRWIDN